LELKILGLAFYIQLSSLRFQALGGLLGFFPRYIGFLRRMFEVG